MPPIFAGGLTCPDGTIDVQGGGISWQIRVIGGGGGGGFTPGGDLAGTSTSQEVIGFLGVPLSSTPATGGQVYVASAGSWVPMSIPLGISPGTGIGVTSSSGIFTVSSTGILTCTTTDPGLSISSGQNPTWALSSFDVIANNHLAAAAWSNNSQRITNLANGTGAQDAAAFGQIPTALSQLTGSIVNSFNSRTGTVVPTSGDYAVGQVTGAAPLASPALSGTPTAPTKAALTNNTDIATTAYADSAVGVETTRAETAEALLAPLASPALTGTPTAPTKSALTNNTDLATTAYTDSAVNVEKLRAQAAEALALPLTGGTMSGAIAMGSHKVTGLTAGTASTDAANVSQLSPQSPGLGLINKISNYVVLLTDNGLTFDATGGITFTLPSSLPPSPWSVTISNRFGATGIVTINPGGTNDIDGLNQSYFLGVGATITIYSDGATGYWTVGEMVNNTSFGAGTPAPGLVSTLGISGFSAASDHGHGGTLYASGNPGVAVGQSNVAATWATSPTMALGTWIVHMGFMWTTTSGTSRAVAFSVVGGSGAGTVDGNSTLSSTIATSGTTSQSAAFMLMGRIVMTSPGTMKFDATIAAAGASATINFYTFFAIQTA